MCGSEFMGRTNAKLCSPECRAKYRRAYWQARQVRRQADPAWVEYNRIQARDYMRHKHRCMRLGIEWRKSRKVPPRTAEEIAAMRRARYLRNLLTTAARDEAIKRGVTRLQVLREWGAPPEMILYWEQREGR